MPSLIVFYISYLIYAIFIILWLNKLFAKGLKAARDKTAMEQYDPFARKDVDKWNKFEIYFCAIFLLPFRLIITISCTVSCSILVTIAMIGADYKKEFGLLRRSIIQSITSTLPRIILLMAGFYNIHVVQLSISSVDPTYPRVGILLNSGKRAPIIVSNHIAWSDIFVHMALSGSPSFLAKKDVANYPLIGTIAKSMQGLFVDRDSRDGKDVILDQINERVEAIEEGKNLPPLLIFPEGTTSNGEYLISFKKGAFVPFAPVKIKCLQYTNPRFNPSMDVLGTGLSVLLTFCQFWNGLTIYEFEPFYPDYLNLKNEEDWKVYADKVKNVMLKTLGCKSSELGFAEKMAYLKILLGDQKKKTN